MAHILVTEDDPFIRDFLTRALSRAGHTVHVASNGLIAHEHLRNNSYDLLIMHFHLPGYSGADLLHEAKARGDGLPVVVHTGQPTPPEATMCADAVLRKPFRLQELLASVSGLLVATS